MKRDKIIIGASIGAVLLMVVVTSVLGLGYMKEVKARESLETEELFKIQEALELDHSTDEYIISESQKEKYNELLKDLKRAVSDQDITKGKEVSNLIEAMKLGFIQTSKDALSPKLLSLNALHLSQAFEVEKSMIGEYSAEVDKLIEQEKYVSAEGVISKWEDITYMIQGASNGDLQVAQIDVQEYPKIKLYLQIQESITGETMLINDFDKFTIMESLDGTYKKQDILKAAQLNEQEKLNINLTADISGSMSSEFENVKGVMTSFLNSIQFDIGDEASLITFDNNINIDVDFTSDKNKMSSAITNMQLGNMTALYDALYVAVSKTSGQTGAKCVIAFTDGYDNYSDKTAEDVINLSKAYKIPVFIVGIGSEIDSNALSHIANSTGGFYENVTSGISMGAIYNEIYRKQKEWYVLEYETDKSFEDIKERKLYISYEDEENPMRSETKFTPKDLMKEPEDYKELINQDMMTSQDVEDEILRIRAIWNEDRENIKSKQYKVTKINNEITAYSSNGDIRMIEVKQNEDSMDYSRTYNYSQGKLIFSYIEGTDAHRLYFKDDRLFRWRYTPDANKRDQAINHDNIGDTEEFNKWSEFARYEGNDVYLDALPAVK